MRWPGTILLAGVIAALPMGGCATGNADEDARKTALAVYQQVLVLRREVRGKIDAELRYYDNTVDTMTRLRADLMETDGFRARMTDAQSFVTDLSKRSTPRDLNGTAVLLAAGGHQWITDRNVGLAQQRKQRARLTDSIQLLTVLNSRYTALERTLVDLSTPPSTKERARELASFVRAVADHYRDLRAEDEKAADQETGGGSPGVEPSADAGGGSEDS